MPGFLHLYVGQEAVAACGQGDGHASPGRCGHLDSPRSTDTRSPRARTCATCMPSCSARRPVTAQGRGGSMHINDLSIGMLGANGIVGGGIPHGRRRGARRRLQGAGLGGGAVLRRRGDQHRGLPRVSQPGGCVLQLPVLFVCENNGYAEFTPQDRHMLLKDVADRAVAYGMPGEIVDGAWTRSPSTSPPFGSWRGPHAAEGTRRCSRPRPIATTTTRASRACAFPTAPRTRSTPGRNATRSPRSSCEWSPPRWLLPDELEKVWSDTREEIAGRDRVRRTEP